MKEKYLKKRPNYAYEVVNHLNQAVLKTDDHAAALQTARETGCGLVHFAPVVKRGVTLYRRDVLRPVGQYELEFQSTNQKG